MNFNYLYILIAVIILVVYMFYPYKTESFVSGSGGADINYKMDGFYSGLKLNDYGQNTQYTLAADTPTDSMFLFANNKSDLKCCPSTFSTDKGCVCVTKQQQELLINRGGNRTGYDF